MSTITNNDIKHKHMKHIFLFSALLGLLCMGVSDTTEERMAWGAATCFAITSMLLAIKTEKLTKEKVDEGR